MAIIYNTIERVGSRSQTAVVEIDLAWDADQAVIPHETGAETAINGRAKVSTDNDGYWEIQDLVANDDITPVNNVYVVTEYDDDESTVYYVYLTDPVGNDWIGDVAIAKPAWMA